MNSPYRGFVLMRLLALAIFSFLFSTPLQAAWYKVETEKFIFYGTSPKSLQEDAIRLERFDALLRKLLAIPEPQNEGKLSVYVLSGQSEVRRVLGRGVKGVAGFYRANEAGVMAVVPRESGDFDNIILNHEYAHHLMMHNFSSAYPAWYVEGFAEFLSTVEFKGDKANLGLQAKHRAYQLYLEDTVPIRTLLSATVNDVAPDQRGNFYGRAWLLTHFLTFKSERSGQLKSYLNQVSNGKSSLEAAEAAFGDLNVLNRDLQNYLRARTITYLGLPFPAPVGLKVTVTLLDPSFGETLHDRLALSGSTREEGRQKILRSLETATNFYGKNADVWTQLAGLKLRMKDYVGSIEAADRAIALDPAAARAFLWKGQARLRQLQFAGSEDAAAWKEARGWLVRGNRANPEDVLILYEYYRSFARERRAPTEAAIAGLRKATFNAPQVSSFRIAYAAELLKSGNYKAAADYLSPIANSPHGGEMTKKYQEIIGDLRAADASKGAKLTLPSLDVDLDEGIDKD